MVWDLFAREKTRTQRSTRFPTSHGGKWDRVWDPHGNNALRRFSTNIMIFVEMKSFNSRSDFVPWMLRLASPFFDWLPLKKQQLGRSRCTEIVKITDASTNNFFVSYFMARWSIVTGTENHTYFRGQWASATFLFMNSRFYQYPELNTCRFADVVWAGILPPVELGSRGRGRDWNWRSTTNPWTALVRKHSTHNLWGSTELGNGGNGVVTHNNPTRNYIVSSLINN